MKWDVNVDRTGFATVFRTFAALLMGNGIVVPVLTEGKSHYWWVLLVTGICAMLVVNMKVERRSK